MNTIEITVPYVKRDLTNEIKLRGGKFQSDKKNWILPNTADNQELKEAVERPVAGPTQKERIRNVLKLSVDLLNGLKIREFKLIEAGDRIVIESTSLAMPEINPVAAPGAPPVPVPVPVALENSLVVS